MLRITEILACVFIAVSVMGPTYADLVNSYDYTLTTESGATPGDISGIADIPATSFTRGNATLTVMARSSLDNATPDLSTQAELAFSVDPNSPSNDLWTDVDAEVRSEAIMIDTATIQKGSYTGTSGTLLFHWSVDGESSISATSHVGTSAVEEMSSSVLLTSTLPGAGEILNVELDHDAPNTKFLAGGTSFSIGPLGLSTGTMLFAADWTAAAVNVEFTLHSVVRLKASTNDSDHFDANLVSDFYSTATLDAVSILDDQGNWIPDATMTSTDGSNTYTYSNIQAVPEPSAFLLLLVAVCGVGAWRIRSILQPSQSTD